MQQILVTGGAGFIGSNWVRFLLAHAPNVNIVVLDKLTYAGNLANLEQLAQDPRYTFLQGDITDTAMVARAMTGCDTVVHFAAESHVDRSITDAAPFLQTNILGTAVLLDVARQQRIQRFLHISTDEVYGEILEGSSHEEYPLRPTSPYAASKAAGDLLACAAFMTHHVPVIITRSSNNFGPYQFPEKIIPLFITNILEGTTVPLYGDGLHVRDWLAVEDHCAALHFLLERGVPGEIYNIGGGHLLTNRELARRLTQALGVGEDVITPVADRPAHDRRYALDGSKLARLGWRPRHALEEALAQTVQWYRDHRAWWAPLKERLRADPYHWLNRTARPSAPQASRTAG